MPPRLGHYSRAQEIILPQSPNNMNFLLVYLNRISMRGDLWICLRTLRVLSPAPSEQLPWPHPGSAFVTSGGKDVVGSIPCCAPLDGTLNGPTASQGKAPAPLKDGDKHHFLSGLARVPGSEPGTAESSPSQTKIPEPSRKSPNPQTLEQRGCRSCAGAQRRPGKKSRSGQAAEISEAVGRRRPLPTSAPKPLLPRKPSLLRYTATATVAAASSFHPEPQPLAEGASER